MPSCCSILLGKCTVIYRVAYLYSAEKQNSRLHGLFMFEMYTHENKASYDNQNPSWQLQLNPVQRLFVCFAVLYYFLNGFICISLVGNYLLFFATGKTLFQPSPSVYSRGKKRRVCEYGVCTLRVLRRLFFLFCNCSDNVNSLNSIRP